MRSTVMSLHLTGPRSWLPAGVGLLGISAFSRFWPLVGANLRSSTLESAFTTWKVALGMQGASTRLISIGLAV